MATAAAVIMHERLNGEAEKTRSNKVAPLVALSDAGVAPYGYATDSEEEGVKLRVLADRYFCDVRHELRSMRKLPLEEQQLRAAIVLQKKFRGKILVPQRLHRRHLVERLEFESRLISGTWRLVNQIVVFALLMAALNQSADQQTKRGIQLDLDGAFDFQEIQVAMSST